LTELLVVIAILGVLVGLLLSAVQRAREAANCATCSNNLKQLGLGLQEHHAAYNRFMSGGWGGSWIYDPDRASDHHQPGGWVYAMLPFIEQQDLHAMGAGLPDAQKQAVQAIVLSTPIPGMNCPSRRNSGPFPVAATLDGTLSFVNLPAPPSQFARTDYAANCGSSWPSWPEPVPELWNEVQQDGFFTSLAEGDQQPADNSLLNGIIFPFSEIRMQDITRGSSNVIAMGEKFMDPTQYVNGNDTGDSTCMYTSFGRYADNYRWTKAPPMRDVPLYWSAIFGSAHPSGANFLFCDGSVRQVDFNIDAATFTVMGDRNLD